MPINPQDGLQAAASIATGAELISQAPADLGRDINVHSNLNGECRIQVDMFRRISSIGRGGLQFDLEMKRLPLGNFKNCWIIDEIVFDLDGLALTCCGMNLDSKGIVIGGIDGCSLTDLFLAAGEQT